MHELRLRFHISGAKCIQVSKNTFFFFKCVMLRWKIMDGLLTGESFLEPHGWNIRSLSPLLVSMLKSFVASSKENWQVQVSHQFFRERSYLQSGLLVAKLICWVNSYKIQPICCFRQCAQILFPILQLGHHCGFFSVHSHVTEPFPCCVPGGIKAVFSRLGTC